MGWSAQSWLLPPEAEATVQDGLLGSRHPQLSGKPGLP